MATIRKCEHCGKPAKTLYSINGLMMAENCAADTLGITLATFRKAMRKQSNG